MYSALYYPHTTIQDTGLLRTALLMWDELHYIVPHEHFTVNYATKEENEAIEIIGRQRVPSSEEQAAAHDLIEDFVTRPLPAAFNFALDVTRSNYELYPQKLMPSTWELLRNKSLVGRPLANADYPSTAETGMSLMSILADCCAGDSLSRVTDYGTAYAAIAGALVEEDQAEAALQDARRELMSVPVEVASVDKIPLGKLVELRKNEQKNGSAAGTTRLRHNLVDDVNEHAKQLAVAKTPSDRSETKRLYRQKLEINMKELHEALKLEATTIITSKEILTAVLGGVGAIGALALNVVVPVVGIPAAAVAIGGLLSTRAQFARTRSAILDKNPMAYLYEARGGFARL